MTNWPDYILAHEGTLRLSVFAGILLVMITAESLWPRRARVQNRGVRWVTNAIMVVLGTLALRLLFPIVAVGTALWASGSGWGLFNLTAFPLWLEIILAVILLDLAIYAQHVASHHIPIIWRFHKVHHTDRDLDASSALRFHPVEIAASMLYKMGIVLLLGPAAIAVIIFEIMLSAGAVFNHANVRLPLSLDQTLRRVIVTPDYHRVHHSTAEQETNSNYGFFLSVWDYVFGTYRAQPALGQEGMYVGLSEYQNDSPSHIRFALTLPFKR